MKKESLFLGVLAVVSLASCSDDKVTGISPSVNGEEITYSVVTNKATRSTLYSNSTKPESFYVWAATEDGNAYIEGDQIVTTDEGVTYTDATSTHYWPSSSLSFYATNYENLDVTSTPTISDYTVATNVAEQEDLLYAVATEQASTTNSGAVSLNFRHALAQIVFQAKNEAQLYVTITGVGVNKVSGTGTFTFPEEATATWQAEDESYITDSRGGWTLGESTDSYTINFDESESVTLEGKTDATALTSGTTALLLLPQTTTLTGENWDSDDGNAYLTLECAIYNMAGESYDADNDLQLFGEDGGTATIYFPLAITWEAGKKYTYLFDFGGSGSDNPSGETDEDEDVLVPITYSVTVDEFVAADVIEEDVAVESSSTVDNSTNN